MIEESAKMALEVAKEAVQREEGGHPPSWLAWATFSTMFMALFPVFGGLLAGITGNDAIIDRQKQLRKLIDLNRTELEAEVLLTRLAAMESAGQKPDPSMLQRIETKTNALDQYTQTAEKDEEASKAALEEHELFAIGTTILSMAITLTGMAVIVRRRPIWYSGVGISVFGAGAIIYGIVQMIQC